MDDSVVTRSVFPALYLSPMVGFVVATAVFVGGDFWTGEWGWNLSELGRWLLSTTAAFALTAHLFTALVILPLHFVLKVFIPTRFSLVSFAAYFVIGVLLSLIVSRVLGALLLDCWQGIWSSYWEIAIYSMATSLSFYAMYMTTPVD